MKRHGNVYIISESEQWTMVTILALFLCITRGFGKSYRLFTGQYSKMLGCTNVDFSDSSNRHKFPARINGIKVEEVRNHMMFGGDLKPENSTDIVEFMDLESEELLAWLKLNGWNSPEVIENIRYTVTHLIGQLKRPNPFYIVSSTEGTDESTGPAAL